MIETLILSYKLVIEVLSVFVSMNIIVSTCLVNLSTVRKFLLHQHLYACKITENMVFHFESPFFFKFQE